jgi:squalene-hopene/tetraprenyl-beta-curcumene cyclase
MRYRDSLALVLALSFAAAGRGEDKPKPPTPNSPKAPLAKALSLARSAAYLDGVALAWTQKHQCGSCHTNYPYLMARPSLKAVASPAHDDVRRFFEGRAAGWDSGAKGAKPRWDTEVVATAVTLAFHDAQTTGKLHAVTRQALDRMWTLQKPHGAWDWIKCDWPPLEHDDYFGATFAALGVSVAPDGYAETEAAKAGLAKLRDYFRRHPAPDLHHRSWLLWASLKLDGLMTAEERATVLKELVARQRPDGGWSLPSLGAWKRRDGSPNDPNSPSDGYATGLVVYLLRQTGMPTTAEPVQRGVAWLKTNQRASGQWFTRSLNNDRAHYITHAGTAFAVMALRACDVPVDSVSDSEE